MPNKYWTRERIIEAIRDWVDENDKVPGYHDMNGGRQGKGRPSATTAQTVFGTWTAAVKAAGFEPRQTGMQPELRKPRLLCDVCGEPTSRTKVQAKDGSVMCRPCRHASEKPVRYSDEQMLNVLRQWAGGVDKPTIVQADKDKDRMDINPHSIAGRFGGWNEALRAAGIKPPSVITDEDCLLALRRWASSRRTHLTCLAARRDRLSPNTETIRAHFGSWNAALEAAGLPLPSGQGIAGVREPRRPHSRNRQTVTGGAPHASTLRRGRLDGASVIRPQSRFDPTNA